MTMILESFSEFHRANQRLHANPASHPSFVLTVVGAGSVSRKLRRHGKYGYILTNRRGEAWLVERDFSDGHSVG